MQQNIGQSLALSLLPQVIVVQMASSPHYAKCPMSIIKTFCDLDPYRFPSVGSDQTGFVAWFVPPTHDG